MEEICKSLNGVKINNLCLLPKGEDLFEIRKILFFTPRIGTKVNKFTRDSEIYDKVMIHLADILENTENPKVVEREIKNLNLDQFGIHSSDVISFHKDNYGENYS